MRRNIKILALIFIACTTSACESSAASEQAVLEVSSDVVLFDAARSTASVKVTHYGDCSVEVFPQSDEWCKASLSSSSLTISVIENEGLDERSTGVRLTSGNIVKTVSVRQKGADAKITVTPSSVTMDYFDTAFDVTVSGNVDYEVSVSDSWLWQSASNVTGNKEKVLSFAMDVNDTGMSRSATILFEASSGRNIKPVSLKVVQNSRPSGYVEGEYGASTEGVSEVFADELCTSLKPGTTFRQIAKLENKFYRNLAAAILDNDYDTEFRVQDYTSYEPLGELAASLKTSRYNRYENPTGIYFPKAGMQAIVFVGETKGHELSLRVNDLSFNGGDEQDYPLKEGINKITIRHSGLGYIAYYTSDYKTAPDIRIHIASGEVNGYFDKSKHNDDDWKRLVNSSVYDFFDLKGECVNLCYSTGGLRQYCPDQGYELIDEYDQLISLQWDIMGLKKYDRIPKNHMFGRRVRSGFFADGIGAGFDYDGLCRVSTVHKDDVWGIAHEFGHVNQISPGLKWVSTTEVTNNVYSVCSRYVFNPEYMNLEMETISDCEGNEYSGGRFGSFLNAAIRDGQHWLTQRGPDQSEDYSPGMQRDNFVKLIPIWQLLLYYRYMPESAWYCRDWYGDVAEMVRNSTWYETASNGELQMKFLKNVMDVVKADLSDYFVATGMLTPIDEKAMDDYTRAPMVITKQMCDDVIEYGRKYPKPVTPVLYYLSYFSRDAFAGNLPVEGIYGKGIEKQSDNRIKVSGAIWKNVAVFEAYSGETLRYITMVNSGDRTGHDTYVIYPDGCSRLEAVGVDGKRTLVYGKR